MLYVDTSVIVKLYIKEEFSREVSLWLKRNNQAIPLTVLHELEFTNAIKLKQFRGEISGAVAKGILLRLEEHEKRGVYYRPIIDSAEAIMVALDLSKAHTAKIGSRTLDLLHVASAFILNAERFVTLDERQLRLASVAGLAVEDLRKEFGSL